MAEGTIDWDREGARAPLYWVAASVPGRPRCRVWACEWLEQLPVEDCPRETNAWAQPARVPLPELGHRCRPPGPLRTTSHVPSWSCTSQQQHAPVTATWEAASHAQNVLVPHVAGLALSPRASRSSRNDPDPTTCSCLVLTCLVLSCLTCTRASRLTLHTSPPACLCCTTTFWSPLRRFHLILLLPRYRARLLFHHTRGSTLA